jgi:predicted kinase
MIIGQILPWGEIASHDNLPSSRANSRAGKPKGRTCKETTGNGIHSSPTGNSKNLIVMVGGPGAGKTETAHRIRLSINNSKVISRDCFRKPDISHDNINDYARRSAAIIDRKFYSCIKRQITKYKTLILDATFRERNKREEIIDFAQLHGCCIFFVECICSKQAQLERLNWQCRLGRKKFIKSPAEILDYYNKSSETLDKEKDLATVLQFDTENDQVVFKSIQGHSRLFAEQLINILEQPLDHIFFKLFRIISFKRTYQSRQFKIRSSEKIHSSYNWGNMNSTLFLRSVAHAEKDIM